MKVYDELAFASAGRDGEASSVDSCLNGETTHTFKEAELYERRRFR